jgi:hypothetical protein
MVYKRSRGFVFWDIWLHGQIAPSTREYIIATGTAKPSLLPKFEDEVAVSRNRR